MVKIMIMDKQKEFEILVKGLALAHHHFSLNEIIHAEISGKLYEEHQFFWNTIQLGLEQSYLVGLAKFFERPKELDETISVYYFFDFGHNDLINKLKKIRNKMVSHHDKKITEVSFLEELKMDREDIRKLFKIATEAVEKLKEDFGYVYQDHVITGFEIDKFILRDNLRDILNLPKLN
jgi:hypothetical protein